MPLLILVTLFVIVPIAEISLLLHVSDSIGGWNTILFVIFTAILGAYLVKQQGLSTIASLQNEMNSGRIPAMQLAEGVALLFAGAVLLTPGFMTDAIGFALLTPPIRRALILYFVKQGSVKASYTSRSYRGYSSQSGDRTQNRQGNVIEGEFKDGE